MTEYAVGGCARVGMILQNDLTDELVDGEVTLWVTSPDGCVTTPALEHVSTGRYAAEIHLTTPGAWRLYWASSGPVVCHKAGILQAAVSTRRG